MSILAKTLFRHLVMKQVADYTEATAAYSNVAAKYAKAFAYKFAATVAPAKQRRTLLSSLASFLVFTFVNSYSACATEIHHLKEWSSWCTAPGYLLDMEKSARTGNESAAKLQALTAVGKDESASIFQVVSAQSYLGKRVRFSALVKTESVASGASLWMMVENAKEKVLAFDDMSSRSLKGTKDWTECSVVLDVPQGSNVIRIGFMMKGNGTALMKNVQFEALDKEHDAQITAQTFDSRKFPIHSLTPGPLNISFVDASQDEILRLNKWGQNDQGGAVITLEPKEKYLGKPTLRFEAPNTQKFTLGSIHQLFSADKFIGKRIKWSAYVKTANVKDWCALLAQVDDSEGHVLAFDAMENRPVKGNTDWDKVDVVLNVPPSSHRIKIGFFLAGEGTGWISDGTFETVDASVPVTGVPSEKLLDDKLPAHQLNKQPVKSFE